MRVKRSAFTLMELVVVVAILAALAGLVINKVDWIRRQASLAVGAATSGDVANNIQEYLAVTSQLPNGLDSLVDSSTGALTSKLIGSTDGVGNLPSQLTPGTISWSNSAGADKSLNSLVRMGMSYVNNMVGTASNASSSGTAAVALSNDYPPGTATGAVTPLSSVTMAVVIPKTTIWNTVFPANLWSNATINNNSMVVDSSGTTVQLVALGIGPGNSMNGTTMISPPLFPGPNSNLYYYRYVAIFSVYSDGRRAQLKTVVEPFGRPIDSDFSLYTTSGVDDVPPGVRTPE